MSPLLWQTRVLYGVAAMSVSAAVFSFLQEREEQEGRALEIAEQQVTSTQFFQAMERLPLSTQQQLEMRKFWRNLCNRKAQEIARTNADADADADRDTDAEASGAAVFKSARKDGGDHLHDGNANASDDDANARDEVEEMSDGPDSAHISTAASPEAHTELRIQMREVQHFAREYKRVFPELFPEEEVLEATRLAAETSSQWNGIVGSTSSMVRSTGKRFRDIALDTRDEMQGAVHRTVRKYLERALDVVAHRLKNTLKDRHMPVYLKENIDMAVDQFMPDVKMEIFRKTRDLFGQDSVPPLVPTVFEDDGVVHTVSPLGRLRGHILYHMFPHDRSIWWSFKDPWWLFYSGIGVLPMVGQLWWLLLFLLKDKTNEHQLCQFIVGFKVSQFISLGLFSVIIGVSSYIKCIIGGAMELCRESGPALESWNAFFFILQIALVWTAFFRLPYTDRPVEKKHPLLYRTSSMDQRERPMYHDIFGNELHLDRGGYLMKLCGYETVSFSIIVALTCMILWFPFEMWQRKALFYWLRTAYGLFSLPFVVFKVPVLANVLMHTRRMGYNQYGETVVAVTSRKRASNKNKNSNSNSERVKSE